MSRNEELAERIYAALFGGVSFEARDPRDDKYADAATKVLKHHMVSTILDVLNAPAGNKSVTFFNAVTIFPQE